MSSKYKIKDHQLPHFLTFSVVQWIDALSRSDYKEILVESLRYCQKEKGLIDPAGGGAAPDFDLPGVQEFTYGAVSYSENEHTKTWYSYDELGRVKWMATWYKQIFEEPKVVCYVYDFTGNVTMVNYQPGKADAFHHYYQYDADNRLSKVFAAEEEIDTQLDNADKLQATYDYYIHGPLKRVKLADDLQNIDYYYTIQGWLKSINDPRNMTNKQGELDDHFAPSGASLAKRNLCLLIEIIESEEVFNFGF